MPRGDMTVEEARALWAQADQQAKQAAQATHYYYAPFWAESARRRRESLERILARLTAGRFMPTPPPAVGCGEPSCEVKP